MNIAVGDLVLSKDNYLLEVPIKISKINSMGDGGWLLGFEPCTKAIPGDICIPQSQLSRYRKVKWSMFRCWVYAKIRNVLYPGIDVSLIAVRKRLREGG